MQKVIAVVKDADGVEHRLSMFEGDLSGTLYASEKFEGTSLRSTEVERIERPLQLPQNLGAVIRLTWPDVDDPKSTLVRTSTTERLAWFEEDDAEGYSDDNISGWVTDGATIEVLHEGWVQP